MRIIKRKAIEDYARRHPKAAAPLHSWFMTARHASWKNLSQVRKVYAHADAVKVASGRIVTVFNIAGNHYRLVTAVHYDLQRIFILRFLTHAEYSKNRWKDTL